MKGGDLFWIWKPYDTYIQVDKLYGKMNDTFVVGQTLMNIVENTINIAAVSLHFKNHPAGLVVGTVGLSLTLGKTILYSLLDVLCNFCNTGHNDLTTLVLLYILPNGLWLLFPFIGIITLGNKIVHLLYDPRGSKTVLEVSLQGVSRTDLYSQRTFLRHRNCRACPYCLVDTLAESV